MENHNETFIANKSTRKKIGFFSAIILVIGSTIGAGIFFKSSNVLSNSSSNIYWAIFSWVVAAIAVVTLGLALLEIASARNDNLSMIGWTKTFNGKWIYKACKWFMTYIYIPFTYFFMPLYVIQSLQDALKGFGISYTFGTSLDWIIWLLISLGITVYFLTTTGLSAKFANIQNWVITSVKFFPLVIAILLGFILAANPVTTDTGTVYGGINNVDNFEIYNSTATTFFQTTPLVGIFGSMAAIFFAYDGFYVTAGISSEMKNPKKTPLALVLGIVAITIIYIAIAIAMSLGTTGGSFGSFENWLAQKNAGWVFGVVNLMIAFGVLGIINGFSSWGPRFVVDLINEGEIIIPARYVKNFKRNANLVGLIYVLILSIPTAIILTVVGALAYFGGGYVENNLSFYDLEGSFNMARIYNFADLMASWTSTFAFAFIALSVFGGIVNRYTKRIKTTKYKHFMWTAYVSLILVGLSVLATVVQPFFDIYLLASRGVITPGGADRDQFIGTIILIELLILFLIVCVVPTLFEERFITKRINALKRKMNATNNQSLKDGYKFNLEKSYICQKTFNNDPVYKVKK